MIELRCFLLLQLYSEWMHPGRTCYLPWATKCRILKSLHFGHNEPSRQRCLTLYINLWRKKSCTKKKHISTSFDFNIKFIFRRIIETGFSFFYLLCSLETHCFIISEILRSQYRVLQLHLGLINYHFDNLSFINDNCTSLNNYLKFLFTVLYVISAVYSVLTK